MRILVVSPIYLQDRYPISHILRGLVKGLTERGHQVSVLTTQSIVFSDSSNLGAYQTVPISYCESTELIWKILNSLLISLFFAIKIFFLPKPDIIYCPVPPNMSALFLIIVARFRNVKVVINTQDIHPDVLIHLGTVKSKILIKILKFGEMFNLKYCTGVTVIANSFEQNLLAKYPRLNLRVIPNWVDLDFYKVSNLVNSLKISWGIPKDKFVVLYAGTFGRIHGTSLLLDVAKFTSNPDVLFLLVGHGADFQKCRLLAEKYQLDNVLIKEAVDYHLVPSLQQISNLSVVVMLPNASATSLPSKLLAYMASAKPILALVESDSDVANIINMANCGTVDSSYNPEQISCSILNMLTNASLREKMGVNSRGYAESTFSLESYVSSHLCFFEELMNVTN